MKMTALRKSLSLILVIVLIAAMALITAGCGDNKTTGETNAPVTDAISTEATVTTASGDITVLGEGAKAFDFTVIDYDGKETDFLINTDKETVGEALLDLGLIEGDDGDYGLYVKVVNGIKADYDTDGKYWAFYIDGEYAMSGVDSTNIEEGKTYTFKVE